MEPERAGAPHYRRHQRSDKRDELSGHLAALALDVRTVRAERIVHLMDVFRQPLLTPHLFNDETQDIAATNAVVSLGVATDAEVKAFMKAAED